LKPLAGSALCAALLLSGCADTKRSTCVRTEKREYNQTYCVFHNRDGGCQSYGNRKISYNECAERVCNPGFNYGPNKPTSSFLVPRGCLSHEEAAKKGQG